MNTTTRQPLRIFALDQVIQALEAKGIPFQIEGRQVSIDLTASGHHHVKITPHRGLYLDASTGKGGTIAALLRQIHAEVPAGAQAPVHPAEGGQSSGPTTTHEDARRIWDAGWTCTYAADMPGGWDKGLNAAHKANRRGALEKQRDTVRAYLSARLGPDHLDHWSRQVRIGKNGLMLTPMTREGVITGIQRTFFDASGHKTERKMLGPQGITFCPVPPGVAPRDLGVGAVKLAGEGWETIASTVQAAGWPGLACQFDGGVVKWAQEQAQVAAGMTQEQIASAPAIIFPVDRDLSGAGQKASARAVKTLRAAGLKAFYAIPPAPEHGGPKGGPKGSDWGDYPREGISNDVLAAHLALAVAHGDQEMPEVDDEPGMALSAQVQIQAWRPAQTPQAAAQSGPTHEVRAGLQTALQQTVANYLEWMKDKDAPFHPVLMMPTTGTGKSTAAKALTRHLDLRMQGGRVCVFVPDHAQAAEYESEGFFHFYGRNPEPGHPGYCPNHSTCQEAMDKGHISQAEVCKSCSNGFAWQIQYYSEGAGQNSPTAADRVDNAKHILAARGLDWRKVTPCVWQSHLRDALEALFVVAASGSYSHSLTRDSLVIFDEHFEPGNGVNVTLQDVDHWSRRNETIIENLAKSVEIAAEKDRDDKDKLIAALASHRQASEFFKAVAQAMAGWVGKTGSIGVDAGLLEAIKGILEAAKQSSKADIALAGWEKLQFNAAGEMSDNPLRAAHAIAESIQFGDGFVNNGELIVAHSLPVMERLASGAPTVIMDATPDPVVVDVVQAQGGVIVNAIARQNVKVIRHPTRFWGLTPLNVKRSGAERRDREIQKYESLMAHHDGAACLFHKKVEDVLDPDDENPMLGHWGRHHRAHNAWTGKALVIVGSFFPPMEAWRAMYQVSRIAALSAGANPDHWPAWPDNMELLKDEWICEGDHEVQCRLPLPADDRIREWLLSRVTSETVQAVGRARGANAENTIDVHIYGGVPLHGLWQYGLSVDEYTDDPECLGQTKAEHLDNMDQERQESLARVDMLAGRVISKGQTVTRQTLEEEVNAMLAEAADRHEPHLLQGGYIYHSTPEQKQTLMFQMPHDRVVTDWIATRMPVLSRHLSTKGRNGGLVRAAQSAARRFGEEMLQEAMDLAEAFMKAGISHDKMTEAAWQTVEGNAPDPDIVAARLILEAMGRTGKVPLPWDELEEVQS